MVPYKCTMGILAKRKGRLRQLIPEFNTGQSRGIPGRTAGTKAHIINNIIAYSLQHDQPVALVWFDLVKGYDLVTKAAVSDSVDCIGWGDDYKDLVLSSMTDFRAHVRTPYGPSLPFAYGNGVKQGDPASPDIYIDWMEMLYRWADKKKLYYKMSLPEHIPRNPFFGRHVTVRAQGWIDDFGLITSPERAQKGVDIVNHFARTYNAQVSNKTEALAIGWQPDQPLQLNQELILWNDASTSLRILGYFFNPKRDLGHPEQNSHH